LQGEDYTKALQCAEICLGLLSKGNRDLHTQRSIEIPYAGGLFCAERTKEHRYLYEEGEEAVFWDDADECADRCFELLGDEDRRKAIADEGHRRCIENGHFNEDVMEKIIEKS
jgi:spore maturation protein CgeB